MPSRIVRDGINSSRAVCSLPEEAELFYRKLMLVVDDYGRIEADPEILRAGCFVRQLEAWPIERVERCLAAVNAAITDEGNPLVRIYQVGSKRLLEISNFQQRTRSYSKYPCPEGCTQPHCFEIEKSTNLPFGHTLSKNGSNGCGQLPDNGGQSPPRVTRARSEASAESESKTKSKSESSAEKPPSARAPEPQPARELKPVGLWEARIRALADGCPDSQDFEAGVKLALKQIKSSADPDATLQTMELNIPLWFIAMREGRARTKCLRFIIADQDYTQKPRAPGNTVHPAKGKLDHWVNEK